MRLGFLNSLFSKEKLPAKLRYEDARAALESRSRELKRELASRDDAPPETLYYLAGDDGPETRALVAANRATPIQANELLQADPDEEVRAELARKIARLLPDLAEDKIADMRDRVIAVLEKLARDELPRIRQIVAEEVKGSPHIPASLANMLARDVDILVSGPVLEYSPLLSDADILEIIATTQVEGVLAAVAKRGYVGPDLSQAIVASLDIPAITKLLTNSNSNIREETLDQIMAQAESAEALHSALVFRPELSLRAIRRIAVFVSRSLIDELGHRHDLDSETRTFLKSKAQQRIEHEGEENPAHPDVKFIREAYALDRLTNDVVTNAANAQQTDAVMLALSLKADLDVKQVTKIITSKSGKGIAALCWRAGLSMRTALAIETHIAKVPVETRVLPREGIHYPMNEKEMLWHLQYFGIKV